MVGRAGAELDFLDGVYLDVDCSHDGGILPIFFLYIFIIYDYSRNDFGSLDQMSVCVIA